MAKFPIIDIWDDHEFTDDAWQMYSTYDELATLKGKGTGDKAIDRCTNAMKAFIEYVPFDDSEWANTSGLSCSSFRRRPYYRDFVYVTT